MYRALTSSNRSLVQCIRRSVLNPIRTASSTDPEAGSVASSQGAFGAKEKSEEARWVRRQEAEQATKPRAQSGQSKKQRLAALETEKKNIEQEIAELKRQK